MTAPRFDDQDEIHAAAPPLKKKPRGIAAQFMKAEPDATAVSRRTPDNAASTMDERGVQDIVGHMGEGAADREHAAMTEWNPADPWSADNPAVARELARKRKIR